MSIFSWVFKSKKEMAKPDTKRVKVGQYTISRHAQNRVADPARNLKKGDMIKNLFGKSENSDVYTHADGTKQYDRVNNKNRTITNITKEKKVVKTIKKFHDTERGKRQAYRHFSKGGKNNVSKK